MEVIDEKYSTAKIDYEQEQHIQTPFSDKRKEINKKLFCV